MCRSSGIQEDSESESMHSESATAAAMLAGTLNFAFPLPLYEEIKGATLHKTEPIKSKKSLGGKVSSVAPAQPTAPRIGSIEELLRSGQAGTPGEASRSSREEKVNHLVSCM